MDFSIPPEVLSFRQELREFLAKEWPDELRGHSSRYGEDLYPREVEFRKKLGERGWLTLAWPAEFGGQQRTPLEYYVFFEEMFYHEAPLLTIGSRIVAPVLIAFGDEEQRARILPQIASGDIEFCLGYSEPDAGSDLASLQTRAEDDGDYFVVNGVKRWTSFAHCVEYCWLAVRTEPEAPKHKGISLMIAEMNSPGISVRPIHTMGGVVTNEVYFDNVRIPRSNLVGEKNYGWYYVTKALDYERISAFPVGGLRVRFDRLLDEVRGRNLGVRRLREDPLVRQKIAEISIEIEAAQVLGYRVAWMLTTGMIPNHEVSMLKFYGTEAQQRMSHLAMQIADLYGQLRDGSPDVWLSGELEREYRMSVLGTIGAGANELQRDIVGIRGLGLPRS